MFLVVVVGTLTFLCSKLSLDNTEFFWSFPICKEHQSVSEEGIAGGKWVFTCVWMREYNAIFPVNGYLVKAPHIWKIPEKVLEFCHGQREITRSQSLMRKHLLNTALILLSFLFPVSCFRQINYSFGETGHRSASEQIRIQ